MRKLWTLLIVAFALIATILPPQPVKADYALMTVTGNPLTSPTAPYLVLSGLSGQSACTMTINTAGGTFAVEGLYKGTTTWTPALLTVSPDGTTQSTTETAVGSYVFNCASMINVRVDGTSASGTPSVTLNASGGTSRILGAGVNGGRTTVAGSSPIVVTNAGTTATVSCPTCFTGTPAPPATPVITSGPGIAVLTPSPNNYVINNTGITGLTAGENIQPLTGSTPTVATTDAPTFGQITDSGLTSGNCMQASTLGLLTTTGFPCGSGNGTVTSVTGTGNISTTNSTTTPVVAITAAPTFGQVTDSGLTSGNCVQASTAGLLTTVAQACGIVASVSASTNIVVAGTATVPTVALTSSPSVSGGVIARNASGAGFGFNVGNATISNHPQAFAVTNNETPTAMNIDWGSDDTQTVNTITGKCGAFSRFNGSTFTSSLVTVDCSANMGVGGVIHDSGTIDSTLTASKCVATNASKQLVSSAGACTVAYQDGVLLGGLHIESGSVTVPATTAVTVNFGATYNAAPACGLGETGINLGSPITMESGFPTTTQIQLYNSTGNSRTGTYVCSGF